MVLANWSESELASGAIPESWLKPFTDPTLENLVQDHLNETLQ